MIENIVEKQTGFVDSFDGNTLYYETRGRGTPIFFLYGIVCTTNHWRHQLRYFSQSHQTIVMDYRGHHKSPKPPRLSDLRIEALARDAKAVLDHLQIKQAAFVGHSFGVPVMIRAYDIFPEIFSSMVALNGFARSPIRPPWSAFFNRSFFEKVKIAYETMPETFNYLWKTAVNNPLAMRFSALAGGFNPQLTSFRDLEIYASGVAGVDLDVFIELFNDMVQFDGRPTLERVRVPALVIGGQGDTVTPLSLQKEICQGIPGCEFLSVPYGTHCTQLDMPEFVNLKIEQFLRNVETPK